MTDKIIELIEFDPIPAEMKRFSQKPRYQDPFVIETKCGEVYTAMIRFCEETLCYYFKTRYVNIPAEEVILIEDRIWDHIKA